MRNLILSALILASAFQTALGQQSGDWWYSVENNQATITSYSGSGGAVTIPSVVNGIPVVGFGIASGGIGVFNSAGKGPLVTSISIPNSVKTIGAYAFKNCNNLVSVNIPSSVLSVGQDAFYGCTSLTGLTMPDRFIAQVAQIGISGQVATDYLVNALANNDAFVTAVANKIKGTSGNYGIATQTGLSSAITTATEPLATKAQITTAINEGKAAGVASVTSSPSTWSMFTSSEVQNMSVGDLVLTRDANGLFVLNYDIQQSEDLQNWTTYQEYALPLTNLPINKAFVRIKAIEGTQEALLDAKVSGALGALYSIRSASVDYYRKYNYFHQDGTRPPVQPYTRTYGDGATVVTAANTTFGDALISERMLDRLMLPIGEYGYSNPVVYTASAITLAQNAVANAKPLNTGRINYPLILCRDSVSNSAATRLFNASADSTRVVFILIPGLSTSEAAALKTKIDGPFNNTILGAEDLVAKAVAGAATGNTAEFVNRGNCLITTSPLSVGRYDAWVYVAHD
jgi:hypothetical protein